MSTTKRILFESIKKIKPLHALQLRIKAERETKRGFSQLHVPPILIYQMGKVGSSTVYKTLKDAALPNSIFHLHFLSNVLIEAREHHIKGGIYPPPYHIYLGESIRKFIKRNTHCPCKIISLVRDPIAMVVSNVFQNPYFAKENLYTCDNTIDPEKVVKVLDQYLRKQFKTDSYVDSYIYKWFDRELKQVFDIDVFAKPFPRNVGYVSYKKDEVEALVIRLEDLSQKGPRAITEFMGLNNLLVLKQANIRNESKDAIPYRQVLKKIRLDLSLCKEIYSNRFVKHFYSEEMVQQFISKWTKKGLE